MKGIKAINTPSSFRQGNLMPFATFSYTDKRRSVKNSRPFYAP